jgi:predicted RNA binding protein YcfA (HicA-like mRNA interferase family)
MGLNTINRLYKSYPDFFDIRCLPEEWEDHFIIIPDDFSENLIADLFQTSRDDNLQSDNFSEIAPQRHRTKIPDAFHGEHPGGFQEVPHGTFNPPPDAMGFYAPFHFFYPSWWGIYLVIEEVEKFRDYLFNYKPGSMTLVEASEAAVEFVYGHEFYHLKFESFQSRMEVMFRKPVYKRLFKDFSWPEERLATYFGWQRVKQKFSRKKAVWNTLNVALWEYIQNMPKPYSTAYWFHDKKHYEYEPFDTFQSGCMATLIDEIIPDLPEVDNALFGIFLSQELNPLTNRKGKFNFITSKHSAVSKRLALNSRFITPRDLRKKLQDLAKCQFYKHGKGSHEKWISPSGHIFPIPVHAGDLKAGTLNNIIKCAGLDMTLHDFLCS